MSKENGVQVHPDDGNNKKETYIDLRSDTVTKPTKEMRKAMAEAEVGDDVYGEDPTVNALQQRAAEMFGKEDALFVPSGTMGNLVSVLSHCKRGDEMILGDKSHICLYEQGGCSSLGSVFPRTVNTNSDGTLPLNVIKEYIRGTDVHHPVTRLVALENTHNYCGGSILRTEYVDSVGEMLKTYSQSHPLFKSDCIKLHMDGARIFNASVALGQDVARMTKSVDSVSVCLSKGLCSPVGSVVVGSAQFIKEARRWRKVVGGGMRQAGAIAACGLISLNQMVDRLSEDNDNAKALVESLKDIRQLHVQPAETNIVFVEIKEDFFDPVSRSADVIIMKMKERGVLLGRGFTERKIRMVLNYHVSRKDVDKIAKNMREVIEAL